MLTSSATDTIDWASYAHSEETHALIETAREHFASLAGTDDLRAAFDGAPRPQLWGEIAGGEYPLVGLPEQLDGIGTRADLAALLEAAGATLLPAALTTHAAAAQTLLSAGMPDAILLDRPMAIATLVRDRAMAFDGEGAAAAVLVSADGARTRVRVLELDDAVEAAPGVDPSRPGVAADIAADRVRHDVSVDAASDEVLAAARMCIAADLVGTAQRALDGALAHALSRRQFDRVIASFQAVKHLLADAHVTVERARSLVIGAAVALDANPRAPDAATLAMLAKAAAAGAATEAAALHVQLLGAMGLTFEADSAWEVRRARHTAPVLGGASTLYAEAARRSIRDLEGATR
jgi:hypothetical protein